jgi:hypothetical protein
LFIVTGNNTVCPALAGPEIAGPGASALAGTLDTAGTAVAIGGDVVSAAGAGARAHAVAPLGLRHTVFVPSEFRDIVDEFEGQ